MTWTSPKAFEESLPVCPVCKRPLVLYDWQHEPTVKFYCGLTLNKAGSLWKLVTACKSASEDAIRSVAASFDFPTLERGP